MNLKQIPFANPVLHHKVAAEVAGEYQLTVLDGNTRKVVRKTPWFDNLVTNIGLDAMATTIAITQNCRIGTGTAAAVNTDTALSSQSASTATVNSSTITNLGTPNYETQILSVYEFALGAVVGNMAEVGVGWTPSTASTLFSRARINDAGGIPTTITVLVTEILQVSYRLKIYPQVSDVTGTVVIAGVTYNYTSRCYNAANTTSVIPGQAFQNGTTAVLNAFNGTINAITSGGPSGTSGTLTFVSVSAYTAGNFFRDYTVTAAIAAANLAGGIRSMTIGISGGASAVSFVQIDFGASIPKDNTKVLTLVIRFTWTRH